MGAIETTLKPVKDYPSWSKDVVGLINTDMNAYKTFLKQQSQVKRQKNELDVLKSDINNMSVELTALRQILQRIEESIKI